MVPSLKQMPTNIPGVWKKATEKFRYKLYEKITAEIEEINKEIAWSEVQISTNSEYDDHYDYLNEIIDQLLPAYNVQIGVADEYIAVVDVNHYRSDMDCFIPLMKHFKQTYGFYPKYPVADAGYGSYNNYIFANRTELKSI